MTKWVTLDKFVGVFRRPLLSRICCWFLFIVFADAAEQVFEVVAVYLQLNGLAVWL